MAKILVVDDSKMVRKVINMALKPLGHDILEAEDGLDGFNIFQKFSDIDLIITDINMPKLNGIEMCQKIKSIKDPLPPTIVLSTEFGDDIKKEGKAVGIIAWIVKPFDDQKMIATVNTLLSE